MTNYTILANTIVFAKLKYQGVQWSTSVSLEEVSRDNLEKSVFLRKNCYEVFCNKHQLGNGCFFGDFLKIKHLLRNTPVNSSFQCSKLLQMLKLNSTVISNQGSNNNDFNDFKLIFQFKNLIFLTKVAKIVKPDSAQKIDKQQHDFNLSEKEDLLNLSAHGEFSLQKFYLWVEIHQIYILKYGYEKIVTEFGFVLFFK